jgi:hypothetical protein
MDTIAYADQLLTKRLYETAYNKNRIHVYTASNNHGLIPTKADDLNFALPSKAAQKIRREKSRENKLYRGR